MIDAVVFLEVLEPAGREFRVVRRVLIIIVTEVKLHRARVLAGVSPNPSPSHVVTYADGPETRCRPRWLLPRPSDGQRVAWQTPGTDVNITLHRLIPLDSRALSAGPVEGYRDSSGSGTAGEAV